VSAKRYRSLSYAAKGVKLPSVVFARLCQKSRIVLHYFRGIPTRVITIHQRYRRTDGQLIMAIPRSVTLRTLKKVKSSCTWHNEVIVTLLLPWMQILIPVAVSGLTDTTLLSLVTVPGIHTGLTDWTPVVGNVVGVITCWYWCRHFRTILVMDIVGSGVFFIKPAISPKQLP